MKVYICSVCGHIEFGNPAKSCPVCSAPEDRFSGNDRVFEESEEKSREASVKHIPSVTVERACKLIPEQSCTDIIVRIGKTIHPMEPAHHIRFIDCYVDDVHAGRVLLTPGLLPGACFHLKAGGSRVRVVENCNLHGYWQTEVEL